MTKVFTSFTKESDDTQTAVREICEQLKPEVNALKNTIGIIHFYYEFAETGICKAVADALPFDVAGCVSSYIGTKGLYGDIALSVTMITSDDASFSIRTLEELEKKSHKEITDGVLQLCNDLCKDEKPKMIIPFLSQVPIFTGDELIATINTLPDPPPFFGTVAFNMDNNESTTHYVMCNGRIYVYTVIFIAFYGNINPKFHVTTGIKFDETFGDTAEITEAEGAILKSVNGMSAVSYLKKLGILTSGNSVTGSDIWAVPSILKYPDGTSVARGFVGIVEGTEHIFSTGYMKVGAKIMFSYLDGEKTLTSAEHLLNKIKTGKENDVLAYSCVARVWSLGATYFAETQKIAECADEYQKANNVPLCYNVSYSGGEICPILDGDGKLVNVMHHFTLIACTFN